MRTLSAFGYGLLAAFALTATVKAQAQDIYFNPDNAVGSGHAEAISFAAWSWSEHSGFAAQYRGTTPLPCIDGAIVVQTSSKKTWPYDTKLRSTVLARSTVCGDGGYLVQLRYDIGADQMILSHEIGHTLVNLPKLALASTHLIDRYTVMNQAPLQVSAITELDASAGVRYARWPLHHEPSYCYVELLPNLDLYIPDINGNRVQLSYEGVVGGNHTWAMRSSAAATNECTNTKLLPDGGAWLHDIRGQFEHYDSAQLEYMGHDTWRLIFAE